ncbi:DUF4347 domain-containing protein [Thauera propionica]|uniref:DUF4347 domain-containing protein n=1 Tax=Thauera propionica TaxID=2019431 RepID=UPI0023F33998|nr:DUF4347 domain-containing protein [Thauera propionica]MDD3674330.1 DUF4347 domain-containing protein [Thauera propionica]
MKSRPAPSASATRFRRKPLITALEPRLLLDGAAVATTVDMATDVDYQDQTADQTVHSASAEDSVHFTEAAAPCTDESSYEELQSEDAATRVDIAPTATEESTSNEALVDHAVTDAPPEQIANNIPVDDTEAPVDTAPNATENSADNEPSADDSPIEASSEPTPDQALVEETGPLIEPEPTATGEYSRRELAAIDTQINDYETLISGRADNIEVILIDAESNGLEQIVTHLQGQQGIDAIHIYSHGDIGQVTLGSLTLNAGNLNEQANLLSQLGGALSENGDLLLYGCYVGADREGQSFLDGLALLTGADVAASNDLTGASEKGGDWELEVSSGSIEANSLATAEFSGLLAVPGVSQLSDFIYTEDSGPITIDSDITISGASDFRGGYIEFSISGATSLETLGINTSASASTASGVISVVGTTVYRGTGSSAEVIGSVDSTLNGQNGQPLRFNLSNAFQNGSFQTGSNGDTVITGWTVVNGRIRLDGSYQIAGQTTPVDSTYPANNGSVGDGSTGGTFTQSAKLSDFDGQFVGDLAIELDTGQSSIAEGYGVIRGPAVYSNGTVALQAGDKISFNWKALSGGDAYDAYGYIINVNTGQTITILDETGSSANQETAWENKESIIASGQEGEYRFVFVAGSYDFTGGRLLGGKLMIDDVTVTQANPPGVLSNSDVSSLSRLITYNNTDQDFATTSRTLTLVAKDGTSDPAGTASSAITLVRVNDVPEITVSAGDSTSANISETGSVVTASGTLTVVDADLSNTVTATVESVTESGTFAGTNPLSNAALKAMLTVTGGAINADTGAAGNLAWSFNSGSATAFDFLATGETLVLTYTVKAEDSDAATANDMQTVTITITGTNDVPAITVGAGDSDGADIAETDAVISASGTLTVVDADLSNTVAATVESVTIDAGSTFAGTNPLSNAALKAMLTVTGGAIDADTGAAGNLAWSFNSGSATAFDFLATGETLVLTYTVKAEESDAATANDTQTVTITITGTNDVPAITVGAGDSDGANITETNSAISASGTLTVVDADLSNTVIATVESVSKGGTFAGANPLSDAALKAMLTVTGGAINADTGAAGNLAWSFNSGSATAFDFLATGETLVLTYTVKAEDSDAATANDMQTVTITITGTNDVPAITVGAGDSDGADIAETDAVISASGTLTVVDADLSNTVAATVESVTIDAGSTFAGTNPLSNAALKAMLTVTGGAIDADTGAAGNLAWSFNSGSATAFDFLATGETLVLTYTVKAEESDAATANDTQTVTITITGTNDVPAITVGAGDSDGANITETNSAISASGTLTVVDADLSNTVIATVESVSKGGTFAGANPLSDAALKAMLTVTGGAINADTGAAGNLAWSFNSGSATAFDFLATGETLVLTYTVKAEDSDAATANDTQTVTITITGTNDTPAISNGAATAALIESDTTLSTSGSMTVTDVDLSDTVAITVDSVSTSGTFSGNNPLTDAQLKAMLSVAAAPAGTAALTADPSVGSTFNWIFNSGAAGDAAFNFLGEGEKLTLTYTLSATDSSGATVNAAATSTVSITITGTNDKVAVAASGSGGYVEAVDASSQAIRETGTISFGDADLTDRIDISFVFNADIAWIRSDGRVAGALSAALVNQLVAGFKVNAVNAPVPGSVPWTYDVVDADLDFLNQGDTITFSYTVTARDRSGVTASDVVQFSFAGTNDAPVADMVVIDQILQFGDLYAFDISQHFSDRDAAASGEGLDFTLTGLPAGLTYSSETGVISGTPTGVGKFTITMAAADRHGASVTRQFVLHVLPPAQSPLEPPAAPSPLPPSGSSQSPQAVDTTVVTNEATPLPTGTVGTGFYSSTLQEAGFLAPSKPDGGHFQAGNGTSAADDTRLGSFSEPGDARSAGNSGTERILVAEGNTRVSEVVSPDGRVTSVRASIQVEVAANGQVVFNDVQKQAFGIVGLSVSSISSGDNGLSVSIADAARGQDTQFYTGELGNGESLPDWITVDQTTGEITIGNPPPGIDAVTVRVKAIGSDGKVRMLDIELKLSDLLKRKSLQDLQPDSTETLEPVGFVPLTDQVAAEVASSDGYGERLIALLEAA